MTDQKAQLAFRLCIAAAMVLVAALLPFWPYSYYRLLRIFVFGAGCYAAYLLWRVDRFAFAAVLGLVVAVFNPVFPLRLTREVWSALNVAGAIVFFLAAVSFRKKI